MNSHLRVRSFRVLKTFVFAVSGLVVSWSIYAGTLSGSGTAESPYLIGSADDWNTFASNVVDGTSGKAEAYYKLSADVAGVTNTVGTESRPFAGVFDGGSNTLTVAITDMENQGTAPFRWISGAVISNLTVTGSVTGTIHTAGLVGFSFGTNRIEACRVSTDVAVGTTSGNRHMGGVVGHAKTSSLTMKDVVFDGTMHTDGDFAGGLQGWSDGNFLAMTNCLFSGTFSGSGKFHPVAMVNYGDVSKMRTAVEGGYYTTGPNADFSGSSVKGKIAAAGTRVYDSLQDGKVMTKTTVMGDEVWIPVSVVMDGLCDLYGITNTVADFSYTVSFDGVPVASNVEYTASYTLNGEQVAGVSAPGKYVLTIAGAEAQGFYGSCTREFLVLSFTEDSNGNTVLSSAYDWAQLSWSCEAGVSWEGKTVVLSNDIGTVSAMVGTSGHPFNGVFDGAGHTLDVAITNTSATGMSPFQYISNATISNLVVTGSVVGNKHVSGLVGMTSGTCVIDSCKVAASVELPGDGWVGSMMGGFVGQAQYATLTIRNCVFSGSMSSPGGYVGGFQGWSDTNHATVSNCLFCGEYSTSVSGHTFFNPIGTRLDTATSVVYNAYYTRAPQWGSNGDTHRKQFDGTAASKTPYASGISRSVTIMDESCYVTVSASVSGLKTAYSNGTNADGLGLTVLFDGAEAEYGVDYDIVISNSTEAVSGAISPGSYTATIVGREGAGYYGSAAAGSFFVSEFDIDGDGSMLVKSNDDLESIARYVTNGMDFAGMTFKLADSILDATAIIGTQDHPFRGVFDGNGKAIFVDIQDTDNQGTALFRCISNATITNLSVGGSVKGTTHAAGLVGFALDSNLIADCEVDVSVAVEPSDASAGKHAGGIVGHSKTSTLTMRDTFYSGTISNDTHYAGGLVGWCDGGVIAVTNSFFCGKHEGTAAFHPIACRAYWVGVTCQLEDAYYTLEPTLENPAYMPSDMHPTFAYLSLDGAPFCRFVKFIGRAPVYLPVTVSMDGLCRTYGITNSVDDFSYTVSFDGVAATNGVQYIAYLTKDGVDVERPEEDGEYVLTVTAIKDSGFYNSHSNKFRVGYAIVDTGTDAFEDGYCYKVASDVAPTNRIIVSGSATLLLCDNTTLTVNRGIGVSDGNALEIVAESYGENAGRLIAELPEGNRMYECAAIGATYSESAFAGTITIRGGRITAKGGKSASGIGCARVSNAGAVNILGGQVTAISGYGQSSAIEAGTITLGWTGPDDFISTSTEDGLYGAYYDDVTFVSKFVLDGTTEVATESNIDNKKIVPPFSLGFPDCCNGSGTEADPYLIRASPQWDALATAVSGAYDTADKHFLLCNDISVTNCIGYLGNGVTNAFSGVFDGGSHTIDVKLSKSSVQCVAPFSRIRNATIKNLKAIGSVLGGRHSAGLVGGAYGTNLIENCVVSVDVKVQEMYCGGILGHGCDSATTIRGCVFDGGVRSLWEQYRYLGTIWGWSDTAAKPVLIDCLDLSDSDKPVGTGGGNPVVSNVIYTASEKITYSEGHPWSDNLWVKGSSGTVKPCFIGPETTDYGFVKAYRSGFLCNGSYYAEEFATSASGKTVPASWLDRFYDSSTTDYPTKIDSTAANGRKVWECYIADVSPTDADADLIATIGLVDGKMKVTVLNGESADRVYTVLGTQTLDPAETPADVTDADDLSTTDYRFFRIAVDLP
ncbi:MAG: hypothetical protein K6F50_03690 [Kiritimatiellae bacterium]|nr:hypothetical protein [Kiritimatiellia bacterium]